MCGLVGVFGSEVAYKEEKMFKDLLKIDTMRGVHSTGVAAVKSSYSADVIKSAVDGYTFVNDLKSFESFMRGLIKPKALLGHNRHATVGAINNMNAHPFVSGSTVLAHNGSLKSGWRRYLHNSDQTNVDSQAVCFNVEHEGILETVKKLNGAFALSIYNTKEKKVSFIRNSERPLYFGKLKDKDVVIYASLAGMITLACENAGVELDADPVSLPTNTLMSFDLSAANVHQSMEVQKGIEFYTTPTYRGVAQGKKSQTTPTGTSAGGTTTEGNESTAITPITTKRESKLSKMLNDVGYEAGEVCLLQPTSFELFKNSSLGKMIGEVLDRETGDVVDDFIVWGVSEREYNLFAKTGLAEGEAIGVSYPTGNKNDHYISITLKRPLTDDEVLGYWEDVCRYYDRTFPDKSEEVDSGSGDSDTDDLDGVRVDDKVFGPAGTLITQSKFKYLVSAGCCMCTDSIEVTDHHETHWVYGEEPLCGDCYKEAVKISNKKNISIEEALIL